MSEIVQIINAITIACVGITLRTNRATRLHLAEAQEMLGDVKRAIELRRGARALGIWGSVFLAAGFFYLGHVVVGLFW